MEMNLELESDEETSSEEDEKFSWRMDPKKSLSDWTISVFDDGSEDVHAKTYHVHKNIISVGPRRAEYFVALMRNECRFLESSSQCSEVHLQPLAGKAFPDMLDYLYEGTVACSTENATALHYLGSYFGVRKLRFHVKKFLKQDIVPTNCDVYYIHASMFLDEKIMSVVVDVCVNNIFAIDTNSRLLQVTTCEFWLQILDRTPHTRGVRRHLSKLVAEFSRQHPELELSNFILLTTAEYLPELSLEAALSFVQQPKFALLETTTECDLRSRCTACIADNWSELNWDDSQMKEKLSAVGKGFLVDLIVEVSSTSQRRLGSLTIMVEDMTMDHKRLKRERRSFQKATKSLKREIHSLTRRKAVLEKKLRSLGEDVDSLWESRSSDGSKDTLSADIAERELRRRRSLSLSSTHSEKSWAHESRTNHSFSPERRMSARNAFHSRNSHTT